MKTAKSIGRIMGLLLVVQLSGLIVPFVLLHPMTTADFLANAAEFSSQIKVAVFLLFANSALTIGISILALPIFRDHSPRMAILLVTASVIMFSLQAVDNVHLMSMLSLSQQYSVAGGANESFQTLATLVRSTRIWAHYPELVAIDAWIFTLYSILYRFALVPRLLAAFGLATVLLYFVAIPLPLILGYGAVTPLGAVMALSHLTLAGWLMVKGFNSTQEAAK